MLTKFRLHNFRTYLNAEISLTPRHLLIGANNSGKTNLCAALRFFSGTATHDFPTIAQLVPGGVAEIRNWAFSSNIIEMACQCSLDVDGTPMNFTYELDLLIEDPSHLSGDGRLELRTKREELQMAGASGGNLILLRNDGASVRMPRDESAVGTGTANYVKATAPRESTMLSKLYEQKTHRRALVFREYLASWLYFALNPQAMRDAWRQVPPSDDDLSWCGDNLATVCYRLKNTDEERYQRVIEHVRVVEPDLKFINFTISPDQIAVPHVSLKNCPRASWRGLSDGTLRCLGLAVIAEQARGSSSDRSQVSCPFVIVEEPENGIFPGQLRKFFDEFEDRASSGQFLFTSHSPCFINFFDASRESVTRLRRNNERTEILTVPPAEDDPDRPLLAELFSMGLFD